MKSKKVENTIREQQIAIMSKALTEPTALLRFTHDEGGIGFHVDLYWKKDAMFRLLALSGQHRMFRHLGRFLKWAANHNISRIEIEPIELTPEMRAILGAPTAGADDAGDNVAAD
jgi:hypothetical protein